ncbi:hypothetical protein BV25DRAFT_1840661 [Artomyces pyxidatus]|uniref:Uncharacterized protein n=1 Tax=Artomyces pyxidatus TaxID=48021 RepID=A0ACB8SSS7_9AGAM|nr:hypothetical protein BV25DRAFT_1840661 [Artomyces pyxidatus]
MASMIVKLRRPRSVSLGVTYGMVGGDLCGAGCLRAHRTAHAPVALAARELRTPALLQPQLSSLSHLRPGAQLGSSPQGCIEASRVLLVSLAGSLREGSIQHLAWRCIGSPSHADAPNRCPAYGRLSTHADAGGLGFTHPPPSPWPASSPTVFHKRDVLEGEGVIWWALPRRCSANWAATLRGQPGSPQQRRGRACSLKTAEAAWRRSWGDAEAA